MMEKRNLGGGVELGEGIMSDSGTSVLSVLTRGQTGLDWSDRAGEVIMMLLTRTQAQTPDCKT